MPLISGGNIDINLRSFENGIYIEIADNGVGRAKAMNEERKSTGKGLEIMSELYSIYNKYYNEKISSEIIDLFDINGRPAGTKVLLKIFNPGEKTD